MTIRSCGSVTIAKAKGRDVSGQRKGVQHKRTEVKRWEPIRPQCKPYGINRGFATITLTRGQLQYLSDQSEDQRTVSHDGERVRVSEREIKGTWKDYVPTTRARFVPRLMP